MVTDVEIKMTRYISTIFLTLMALLVWVVEHEDQPLKNAPPVVTVGHPPVVASLPNAATPAVVVAKYTYHYFCLNCEK